MSTEIREIETVLFDIDGTLVDSNDAHARAWVDAFKGAGMHVAFESIRPLIGMGSDKMLSTLKLGISSESEQGEALVASRKAIFLERYVSTVTPLPGARSLLELLRERRLTCIVASAASADELDPLLAIADVTDLFDHIVRSDEVEATKPDPDIIRAGLGWANVDTARAVMIGDTRFDVAAAQRAGVRCIAVRCGGSSDDDLAQADAIVDTPAALAAVLSDTTLAQFIGSASSPARPQPVR